jgi:hypothetical protein
MKRLASLLLLPALVAVVPLPAHAGSSTDAALGLGAFAVFNQIVRGETIFHGIGRPVVRERVVYVPAPPPPPVIYAPPPAYYAPPPVAYAPPPPPVYAPAPVVYPHGYWVPRRGHWVWVARHHGHDGHHGHPRRW